MAKTLSTNCPFTLTGYRQLIRLAKERFPIVNYREYKQHESFVIWRHDLEYCVDEMGELAEIDTEEGIESTFFVQLHSNLYNFWDRKTVSQVKQWIKWGHDVGLHLDCSYHGERLVANIEELVSFEKVLLEQIYETTLSAFSFHNPNDRILHCQDNYAGLINTYNKDFFNGDVIYVSDSNGRWRGKTFRDVLEDPRTTKAQINVHDTWWTNERIPQVEKLEKAILRTANSNIENYKRRAKIVVEDII